MPTIIGAGAGAGFGGARFSATLALLGAYGGGWFDPNTAGALTMAVQPDNTNSNFAAWTGVNPDATPTGWTKSPATGVAANHVEAAGNACRILSDGTVVYVAKSGVSGNRYTIDLDVSAIVAGGLRDANNYDAVISGTGHATREVTLGGTALGILRSGVTDATFTNLTFVNISVISFAPRATGALNCAADGDFADATAALWPVGAGGGSTAKNAGRLEITSVTTATSARQACLGTGRSTRVRVTAYGDGGAGIPTVVCNGTTVWTGTNSVAAQVVDVTFTAGSANLDLYNSGTSGVVTFAGLIVNDVATPAGLLANSTAANQWWRSTTTVNGKTVIQMADTDVGLSSLPASAWRFLQCGSGGAYPRFVATTKFRTNSLAATSVLLRSYATGKPGLQAYVSTTGVVALSFYDSSSATLQTVFTAAGVVTVGSDACITFACDGTGMTILANGAIVAGPTALTFTPDLAMPGSLLVGNATTNPLVGLLENVVIIAGYQDAASTLAHHLEIAA